MKKIERLKFFIGIDQTGAVNSKGVPKPLPACAIQGQRVHFFYLPRFERIELEKHIGVFSPASTVICLDCVLGLPISSGYSMNQAIKKIRTYRGYGRKIAAEYFKEIGGGEIHRRKVEILAKANSVFQEHPFQKNIQTGTFRFWKEIAENRDDFYIPSIERQKNKNQVPLIEGYPSYLWKTVLKSNTRRPENLATLLRKIYSSILWNRQHRTLVKKDPNLADAFVLALSAKKLYNSENHQSIHPEGNILGFALGGP